MTAVAEPIATAPVTDRDSGERWYPYPPTGEQLDSVTSAISATDSKPYLRTWHATSSLGWACDNVGLFVQTLATLGRKAAIDLGKGAAEQIRDVKADAGKHVHKVQQALILWAASPGRTGSDIALPVLPEHLERALYDGEPIQDVIDAMVDGFLAFVTRFDPEFLATEMQVYSQPLGIAGTLDAIVRLRGYAISYGTGFEGADELVPCPGSAVTACVDTKTGKSPEGTWKEQLAAYRRMEECLLPLGDLRPMPATDCGMVLHLRREHPECWLLHLVSAKDDEPAWKRFLNAVSVYRERQDVKDKPGVSVRPLREDGTMPGPRICDLAGEGWGRALSPLAKALGADAELEDVARFTHAELLAVKGIGPKLAADIRALLAARGLAQAEREVA
jgi:hypothetical protein